MWGIDLQTVGDSLKEAKVHIGTVEDSISTAQTQHKNALEKQNKKSYVDINQKNTTITIPHNIKNNDTLLYVGGAFLLYLMFKG